MGSAIQLTMTLYVNIIILGLIGITTAQQCGIGSQCKTADGLVGPCTTSCPAGTACTQWTSSTGSLDAYYCQFTFCLPEQMGCEGRIGTCCSGLECGLASDTATLKTCNAPATTTTTTTVTTTATTTVTTTTATTTPVIIVDTTTATTTTQQPTTTTPGACLTEGGNIVGAPCVFPFRHRGVTYTSCTYAGGFDKPWCSTATDRRGNHILGNYGDCNSACPAEQGATTTTTTTTSCKAMSGTTCVFPFIYKGRVHNSCTYAGGFNKPWCSTRNDFWGRPREGFWGDCDTATCSVESIWG